MNFVIKVLWALVLPVRYLFGIIVRSVVKRVIDSLEKTSFNKRITAIDARATQSMAFISQMFPKVPYLRGEKMRVAMYVCQPSSWSSFEPVWRLMYDDVRFDIRLFICDPVIWHSKSENTRYIKDFLNECSISYYDITKDDIHHFKPHIFFYQTPHITHIPNFLNPYILNRAGYRIAYFCYGIPFALYRKDLNSTFPDRKLTVRPWRVYELSHAAKMDRFLYSGIGSDHVAVTGLPRFDIYASGRKLPLPAELAAKAAGRRIIFFNLHFPGFVKPFSDLWPYVPELAEYLAFFGKIAAWPDLFFLVRPHPLFFQEYEAQDQGDDARRLAEIVRNAENSWLDVAFDFRPALMNAAYMVSDASSLLIEAAALELPILYMSREFLQLELLAGVKPVFDACYQGSRGYDVERFLDLVVKKGMDYKKPERKAARAQCLPFLDGLCARRIVDDLAKGLEDEAEWHEAGNHGSARGL